MGLKTVSAETGVDLDRLFKFRLVVARYGEMDLARWWNTQGQLGKLGEIAVRRGLPRTHTFARARSVFAVASARCEEVFAPPAAVTLWRLPAALEEAIGERWEDWLDQGDEWTPFFERLKELQLGNLQETLAELVGFKGPVPALSSRLKRSSENKGVAITGTYEGSDESIALLALGFAKSEPGALWVPYLRLP